MYLMVSNRKKKKEEKNQSITTFASDPVFFSRLIRVNGKYLLHQGKKKWTALSSPFFKQLRAVFYSFTTFSAAGPLAPSTMSN